MPGNANTLSCLLAALAVLLLAACGGEGAAPPGRAAADTDSRARAREGRLDVLARAEAPAGDAARLDWVRAFEADSACKVHLRTTSSSAELLTQAAQEDADLILAGGDIAASLVAAGRVRAIEPARVPALATLDPRLRDLPGALLDGIRYGIPWRWQPNVLAYDTRAFAEAPSSWKVLFEPAPTAVDASGHGRVLAAAEPMAIADAALYLAATQPELRIADPYALDERQYAATLALLARQKPLLRGYWHDPAGQAEAFGNGVVASAATPALVRSLQARGLQVAWTVPAEGASAQLEVAMLHSGASHPNCALAWMQWSLSPPAQALLAARVGALPVLPAACAQAPLAGADACARDGMALLSTVHFWQVPQARCGRLPCVPYSRWTRDYLALVGD